MIVSCCVHTSEVIFWCSSVPSRHAAERPAEERQAAAQKAAQTRAERYGDEVSQAELCCWRYSCAEMKVLLLVPVQIHYDKK